MVFTLACRMANQMFLGLVSPCKVAVTKAAIAPFRLWPTDIDLFGHMNNASYVRVAELSRWRMLSESGLLSHMITKRIAFLVVEQSITYSRPIFPFQRYNVTTTVTVSDDDKWLYYHHSFDEPLGPYSGSEGGKGGKGDKGGEKGEGKEGRQPKHYAMISLRAVMKESNGKTVRPSDIYAINQYHRDITGSTNK